MIHITEFDLDVFSTKSFPFAQVQWRYYDLPGRSSLYWTLMLSRQAVKHRWKEEAARREAFFWGCGMDPPSVLIDIWYIWCWSDKTTSSKTPEIPCKTWWIYSISWHFVAVNSTPAHRLKHRPEEVQHLIETSLPWILVVVKWQHGRWVSVIHMHPFNLNLSNISQIHGGFSWFPSIVSSIHIRL